jgi:hypothetical protein
LTSQIEGTISKKTILLRKDITFLEPSWPPHRLRHSQLCNYSPTTTALLQLLLLLLSCHVSAAVVLYILKSGATF